MDEVTAKRILEALRTGVPDQEHILEYTAPIRLESEPLSTMAAHLDEVAIGVSMTRFINGAYGEGKSHTLALLRRKALERNFAVSYFPLRVEGTRFDKMDRVLGEMIRTLSTQQYPRSVGQNTVFELIIKRWAEELDDVSRIIDDIIDPNIPDLRDAVTTYARILNGQEPRELAGQDRVTLLRNWFMPGPAGLSKRQRELIHVVNNIGSNADKFIEGLAIFFRSLGYAGWVVLVDEQEVVPTLMTETQRNRCNENLRLLLDAANQGMPPKGIYYVFASAPEFFTDQQRGVNSYPALAGRIRANAVLSLGNLNADEMRQVCMRLRNIFAASEPDLDIGSIFLDDDIALFTSAVEERYGAEKFKARGFVQSFVALMEKRLANPSEPIAPLIDDVSGTTFNAIYAQIAAAR